jgi:hypothetical protein
VELSIGRIYTAHALDSKPIIMDMSHALAHLNKEYRHLASSLGGIGYISQGSVFERKKGPGSRYQWTWKNKDQKTESLTLTQAQYHWLRQAIANERKVKQTLKKMRQISEQVFARSIKSPTKRK